MPPTRLPDTRAFERIVDYVEQSISDGTLKAGDRLPSERELGEKFGIGRASVREALRVLENMELVRSAPRDPRGPLVLTASTGPVRRSMSMLTSTRVVNLPELIQFRMIADAAANLMAALRRSDEQLLALEKNMARMRQSMDSGHAEFSRFDLEFHEIVAEIGNNKLVQLYGNLSRESILTLMQQKIVDAADHTHQMLMSMRHHNAVYRAIAAQDGILASRLARESLYSYYEDYVEPADREIMAALVRECGGTLAAD